MDRRSFMATTGRATLAGGALAATGSLVSAPAADAAPAAEPAPQRHGDGGTVRFNIISDIQGDLTDFGKALDDLHSVNPRSAGLGIASDITPRGYDFEYAAVRQTLDKHPHPKNVAWAIGNHEFYLLILVSAPAFTPGVKAISGLL
ncbi:metallophosphoesterase [Streptomyces sp. NPDC058293]|uniref:metallophosphoesterase n=1 Tax=Streptomyces sp. NPDC058293 TaxID=3346429 RepID=UPI0036E76D8F